MALIYVLTVLSACLLAQSHAAPFNCTEPPNLGHFNIHSCCRMPEMDLGETPAKCVAYIKTLNAQARGMMNGMGGGNNKNNTNNNNNRNAAPAEFPAYAHICYPECIYRETGSLVENEFNIENVKKFLNKSVNKRDKDIVPQIVRSFESCLDNIKGHMAAMGIKTYAELPMGCSPLASMMYSCVNAETFLHCPAKMWKNEEQCNVAKSFAAQCNPLPHVPLPIG
uniref:Odorant-binding protein n=1 Tax=Zeugodacus cucurbitae TaxID=28588 RepID=A0A6M9TZ51_ZEUCU|nr:odorant-binding protein [Zeugodacus cucurbitae]